MPIARVMTMMMIVLGMMAAIRRVMPESKVGSSMSYFPVLCAISMSGCPRCRPMAV